MAEIVLHHATSPAHLTTLRELLREYSAHLAASPAGAANICLDNFEQELADLPAPYTALLLAHVDGQPAGCIALKPLPSAPEPACELKRLWVRPAFRGHSLGRRLVHAALEQAAALGSAAVYLDTVPAAMPEANRLYTSLGFEPVERYNQNPVADVAFFRRALTPAGSVL